MISLFFSIISQVQITLYNRKAGNGPAFSIHRFNLEVSGTEMVSPSLFADKSTGGHAGTPFSEETHIFSKTAYACLHSVERNAQGWSIKNTRICEEEPSDFLSTE